MTRRELLLKIIVAAEGEKMTPAQLQKVAFLIGKEFSEQLPTNYYEFRKYDYGPFCADVYRDAEQLEREGKVSITVNDRGGWHEYAATVRGYLTEIEGIPEDVASFIVTKVDWARQLSFKELVRAVYEMYPEYRENSVFQEW